MIPALRARVWIRHPLFCKSHVNYPGFHCCSEFPSRPVPPPVLGSFHFDKAIYRHRNEAERAITRFKNFRAIAARFDAWAYVFYGTVCVAADPPMAPSAVKRAFRGPWHPGSDGEVR